MKAIILISSIFYILGLKISNKIDLIKHQHTSVEKVIVLKATSAKSEKLIHLKDAFAEKPVKDSVAGGGISENVLNNK